MLPLNTPFERAMALAAVTGLKSTMGPTLISMARRRPNWEWLALSMVGEMIVDKLPMVPSRSSAPALLPRVLAGFWAAKQSMEADGEDDLKAAAMGAAVAAGVATLAPTVRAAFCRVLNIPDPIMGAAEDALALQVGLDAVGLTWNDLADAAQGAFGQAYEQAEPYLEQARETLQPSS